MTIRTITAILALVASGVFASGFAQTDTATIPRSGDVSYSNGNRELFILPGSAALAASDLVFARDATPHANPAIVAAENTSRIALSYAGFYGNTFSTSVASYVGSVGNNAGMGISLSYLYVPNIPVNVDSKLNSYGDPIIDDATTRFESASEVFLRTSWGMKVLDRKSVDLCAGLALNAQRRNLVGLIGYGMGMDAGVVARFPVPGFGVSVDAENITTNYLDWRGSDYYDVAYPHIRLGLGFARDIPYVYGRIQVTYASADFLANEGMNSVMNADDSSAVPGRLHASDDPVAFVLAGRAGVEYAILNCVSLRVGTSPVNRFTFGAGLSLLKQVLSVDFAYLSHELAGTYQVSLGYRW